LNYYEFVPALCNKFVVLLGAFIPRIINHVFIVRSKRFLKYHFDLNIQGGSGVISYVGLTTAFIILVANMN